jgi:ACS family pantothenate transporter-like MFS transporter
MAVTSGIEPQASLSEAIASQQPDVQEKNPTISATTSTDPSPSTQPAQAGGFFHWHEPNTSREEKRFIFKLDFFVLTYACFSFFVKQLDQNNITNAYSSGMAEELGFGPGDELSWMNTYFIIGTFIGSPFGNLVMSKVAPRFWLPFCVAMWSFFVLFLYKCDHAYQFYILRVGDLHPWVL